MMVAEQRASKDASMTFCETAPASQLDTPSVALMMTRTLAAVASWASITETE